MSFTEQQEDKIITFALSPKDYYYELKLAKFLYKIDRNLCWFCECSPIIRPDGYNTCFNSAIVGCGSKVRNLAVESISQ